MKARSRGKKIAAVLAGIVFTAAILALGATIWSGAVLGSADIATPSLAATTFFLFCCAGVLYAMSLTPKRHRSGADEP